MYTEQFREKEGAHLEYKKIAVNLEQRALARLMPNSMWGKFGQQVDKMQVKEFTEPQASSTMFGTLVLSMKSTWKFHHREPSLCENMSPNLNIFIARFTTCWARLWLYEALELLNERMLYFDVDRVIFLQRPGQQRLVIGNYLGDFTNELNKGDFIAEFCSRGPKKHGYRTKQGKTCCKVQGFSLTVEGMTKQNFQVLQENTLNELYRPKASPGKTCA